MNERRRRVDIIDSLRRVAFAAAFVICPNASQVDTSVISQTDPPKEVSVADAIIPESPTLHPVFVEERMKVK
jgi:hypothetical protein